MEKHATSALMSIAAAFVLGTLSLSASATPISQVIGLDQVYTGAAPGGTAPWLTATFAYDDTSSTGTLTLQSNLAASNAGFVQGANGVTGWGFFLGGNALQSFGCSSVICANTVKTAALNSGPVPGGFNFGFGWTSKNRFDGTDTSTYTLTFANVLTASPFMANGSGWLSYSHVQGIGTSGCSGFIVSGTGTPHGQSEFCNGGGTPPPVEVPEPSVLGIFGLGTLLIGLFIGRRRRFC